MAEALTQTLIAYAPMLVILAVGFAFIFSVTRKNRETVARLTEAIEISTTAAREAVVEQREIKEILRERA